MAEMLTPLQWEPTPAPTETVADGRFVWPSPPYAGFPDAADHADPLPCEIVGLNEKRTTGRLTFFVPQEAVAHVQVPPARTTLPLRFDQFRALTLTRPLEPMQPAPADPHAELLASRPVTPYRIALAGGGELAGQTVGHREADFGLFLFPPVDGGGGVLRMFVPRSAYQSFELGPRIGELLVAQNSTTDQQVELAVREQNDLRMRKLGDVLLLRQVVTPEQLLEAIEHQSKMPMVRVGEALLSLGMISDLQLQAALEQQRADRSVPLGEVLVRMGAVSREDLQAALSRKMGYPLVNIDSFPIEAEALRTLKYEVALRLRLMPLLIRDGRLIVALDDPARRRAAIEEVEFSAQMKALPVLARCRSMDDALFAAYEGIGAALVPRLSIEDAATPIEFDMPETSDALVQTLEKEGSARAAASDDHPIEQSDNSLVRLINTMIIEAHADGVSDIHVESYPGREKIRIRFRKDGVLRTYLELPPSYRNALIARIKIMCDLDISEKRKPQDGKINFAKFSAQHKIELRVASIPTNNGCEDVVMRILASAKPIPLDRLGIAEANLALLKQAVERPYGLVLCVGPTGSGKTTTLHSALSHINVPERKIWTAEDPVEITQPGLRQVQVNPKIDWTFAKALRAFLRADPDVIMVGEIRDQETAHIAIEASLTGHLVLSTLHTNSAPETVTRLLDMGCDPFNFADSLLAVLAQRLVRRLCTHCRTSRPASATEIDELLGDHLHAWGGHAAAESRDAVLAGWSQRHARDGRLMFHASPGCEQCHGSGFKGRAGLHELMNVSREVRHLIQTGQRADVLQQTALAQGMRTLRQDGIDKVLQGVTTIEEVRAMSNG
jgi:type II secretory ATPase GspE/PulE/Tfp pilus assembly ATPase PilB-like protein